MEVVIRGFILFHTHRSIFIGKARVCRLPQNPLQTVLQRLAVVGKSGVHHELAAAKAVRILNLPDKRRDALLPGQGLVNRDIPDVDQLLGVAFRFMVGKLIHGDLLSAAWVASSKSHECAGGQCRQRMVSDFEEGLRRKCGAIQHRQSPAQPPIQLLFVHPSHSPRTPDGRHDAGRLWRGCPNTAASYKTCAAVFPLKSVGGRSWSCISPALSSRPVCHAGSKAA